ncbi:MAG: hypothetical protein CME19_06875 [Gemmatimonadetes bacterium]|nr:hypothetical protein [Gemmatimonadota bacterium]
MQDERSQKRPHTDRNERVVLNSYLLNVISHRNSNAVVSAEDEGDHDRDLLAPERVEVDDHADACRHEQEEHPEDWARDGKRECVDADFPD